MVEQKAVEGSRWPKEYDPDLERVVESNSLYIKVERPKRIAPNKPTRRLTTLKPKSPEITAHFNILEEPYFMEMDGQGRAGDHFHNKKVEVFCPVKNTPLFLYLEHVTSGEKAVVTLVNKKIDTYEQYVILPGVIHTIINPSIEPVPYLVLSNVKEKEAIGSGDVIEHQLDLSTFPSPQI
ncbi:hypothetical protein A2Z23_03440 [Candidatus Curtissbacteria bacterium RBG_16_39_7]|uniref:Glucose-6-phosphate isomerase n=1 Tax=Candidatus Curtissbacteria bacterium RBG_16_39_7 TaxID=1797707 RepID=A0A1F5G3R3_9BACT|nr:MAG: hypothetical protein A2Z23_03440 [Candidatus Curtissbacteria bacterium RBG_16_39_7]